ncbi:uncharacterized protein [Diabrotica undecimpunctata]|uniref:uncharacterized protein n=1 Tax=Diabrotica undecimpunctata TaxID=50387 RepID=UPI003B640F01
MCKLLEKMINKPLLWFFEENNLIDAAQSKFRPNRSTMDNLELLQTKITQAISNKNDVITVALDLESALDTINTADIIRKLEQLNLTGNILTFINNFLQERSFKVVANEKTSTSHYLTKWSPPRLSSQLQTIPF